MNGDDLQRERSVMPTRVLALSPSKGLGGGIEMYTQSVLAAVRELGIEVTKCSLASPRSPSGLKAKVGFLVRVLRASAEMRHTESEVLCFHAGLLPVALLARLRIGNTAPTVAFFHGLEIWTSGRWSRVLRRHRSVRSIAVSSYSAGTMGIDAHCGVLAPGIPASIFGDLVSIDRSTLNTDPLKVLSVFRLEDYGQKGGPELVRATAQLRADGHAIRLTIAGRDGTSELLERDLNRYGDLLTVIRSPSSESLLSCYADANVFALATRQQGPPQPYGEGFGIVLAEAALAGLPVVAPASGGSHDAFLEGVTGVSPRDQSIKSLTDVMSWLASHPMEALIMGTNGREWARQVFRPASYSDQVADIVWGQGSYLRWKGLRLVQSISPPSGAYE